MHWSQTKQKLKLLSFPVENTNKTAQKVMTNLIYFVLLLCVYVPPNNCNTYLIFHRKERFLMSSL